MGDSCQLMSNDDVPRSAGKFDDQQKGGFDRLPQSVQDAIKSTGLQSTEDIHDISGIVKDGNHDPQTGTEIDRELMRKADRMMDDPIWDGDLTPTDDPKKFNPDPHFDPIVRDIFDSARNPHPGPTSSADGRSSAPSTPTPTAQSIWPASGLRIRLTLRPAWTRHQTLPSGANSSTPVNIPAWTSSHCPLHQVGPRNRVDALRVPNFASSLARRPGCC
jgi:hypothetical protein